MSLVIPGGSQGPNPTEKPQLGSHGSAAKELKAAEEDFRTRPSNFLVHSEVYTMKEDQEKQKAVECSVTQFVEESSSSSSSEEEFKTCDVCLKDKAHYTFNCPGLYPKRKGRNYVNVGNGFELVCKKCNVFGVHAACGWKGRVIMKRCRICHKARLHWTSEYFRVPKKP